MKNQDLFKETIEKINDIKISKKVIREILFEVASPVPNKGNIVLGPVCFFDESAQLIILFKSTPFSSEDFTEIGMITYKNETLIINSHDGVDFSISICEENSIEKSTEVIKEMINRRKNFIPNSHNDL